MRLPSGPVLGLLTVALLAGCSGDPEADPPAPDAGSYTITLEGFPVAPIPANTTFTFTDRIEGDAVRASDHIGAHFGANSTIEPSTAAYPVACVHTHGDLPGTYQVTCTAPTAPGTYFLRGHARITTADGAMVNWWSAEQAFVVA